MIEVICLDMAGTTVKDDGMVEKSFELALASVGVLVDATIQAQVRASMGRSKIEVFKELVGSNRADEANLAFEHAYQSQVNNGGAQPMKGAVELFKSLREKNVRIALTTGFSAQTQALLIEQLGWEEVVDLILSPGPTLRGRPHPDMIWHAMLALGASDVGHVCVVGDTTADMKSARGAGVSLAFGVRTGGVSDAALFEAGATKVLDSIAFVMSALLLGED